MMRVLLHLLNELHLLVRHLLVLDFDLLSLPRILHVVSLRFQEILFRILIRILIRIQPFRIIIIFFRFLTSTFRLWTLRFRGLILNLYNLELDLTLNLGIHILFREFFLYLNCTLLHDMLQLFQLIYCIIQSQVPLFTK